MIDKEKKSQSAAGTASALAGRRTSHIWIEGVGQVTRPGEREQSDRYFFVKKMFKTSSSDTQALSECQTIFSDDFGTIKNDLKKVLVRRPFFSEIIFFGRIGSPKFKDFR